MSLPSTGSCGKQRDEKKREWGLQGQRRKRNKIKPKKGLERAQRRERNETEEEE